MDDPAGEDNPNPVCCFHPREAVVGVCALCLKERLLVLAASQGRRLAPSKEAARRGSFSRAPRKKPSIAIPRVFAIGSSLLHRLDFRHVRDLAGDEPDVSDDSSMESLDDSFISIKFEDDGRVSWDNKALPMNPGASSSAATFSNSSPLPAAIDGAQSMVEHAKRRHVRWRKRFGHLLRLPRWKRTSKASVCNVSKAAEGSNGRRARSLARTRATELRSGERVRKEGT